MCVFPGWERGLSSAYIDTLFCSACCNHEHLHGRHQSVFLGRGIAIEDTHMNPIYPLKSPERPTSSLRTSQRQSLACQQCAKAKTRCDKTIPCYRCRRRGLDCRRENVIVSRRSKREVRCTTVAGSLTTPPATCAASDTSYADMSNLHQKCRSTAYRAAGDLDVRGEFQDSPTAIEGLAWGRHQCHSYPHTHCRQFKHPTPTSQATSNLPPDAQEEALPSVSLARKLVDYHLQNLSWYHNSYTPRPSSPSAGSSGIMAQRRTISG